MACWLLLLRMMQGFCPAIRLLWLQPSHCSLAGPCGMCYAPPPPPAAPPAPSGSSSWSGGCRTWGRVPAACSPVKQIRCQQVEQGGCVSEGVSHCLMPKSHLVHLLRQDAVGALVGDLGGRGATERRRHIGLKAGRVVLAGLAWARGASTRITGTRKDCPFKLFSNQAA